MPSLAKNKSKSLKTKKVAFKNGHKNGHKNVKVSAKTAILKKAGKVAKRTFFFGGGKAEGTKEMKNLLGGKGANLAEMANIGLPVPPGFTITTEVCTEFYADGKKLPKALDADMRAAIARMEKVGRREVRRPEEPAAGLGPLGRARVDARHDGHDPQPRPQRRDGRRPGREVGQRALRLRQLPPLRRDVRRRRARPQAGEQGGPRSVRRDPRQRRRRRTASSSTRSCRPTRSRSWSREFKAEIKKRAGHRLPRRSVRAARGAIKAVFRSWKNDRANVYRRLNGIPAEWGTAVNVQAMVFGNMGDDSATGVCFTRDPASGENVFYGEYLVNAQGEDVVAGIRTPQKIEELGKVLPEGLQGAARHPQEAREALPRHAGHRVHHRERQALHAADPQRQAHRLRRRAHRRRDGGGEADPQGGGAAPRGARRR